MSDEELKREDDLLSQLREELEDTPETAVVAPKLSLGKRLRTKYSGLGKFKPLVIRGLAIALALVIAGQLVYQGLMAVNEYGGGPVPVQMAIEQLGDDSLPPPQLPPPPR